MNSFVVLRRAHCQHDRTAPAETSEGSGSDNDSQLPSPTPAGHGRHGGTARNKHSGARRGGHRRRNPPRQQSSRGTTRPYCTMECIHGLMDRGPLDQKCPNARQHSTGTHHQLDVKQLTHRLHDQLTQDRNTGFEILDIRGRTGFMLKASLLSHGYTVTIKATTKEKKHNLQREIRNYKRLRILQGLHIPVYVGDFTPRVPYVYRGELMAHMMILSWSGIRVHNSSMEKERAGLAKVLRLHRVVHRDNERRNVLWNESAHCAIMIDFEQASWLPKAKQQPLCLSSGNARRRLPSKLGDLCGDALSQGPPTLYA